MGEEGGGITTNKQKANNCGLEAHWSKVKYYQQVPDDPVIYLSDSFCTKFHSSYTQHICFQVNRKLSNMNIMREKHVKHYEHG